MTIIIFIRHGQSTSNVSKILSHDINTYPLTEEGVTQAKDAGKELMKLKVEKIYTSPVLRAYQTALIIGETLGIFPIVDQRLRERSLGELNNTTFDPNDHWKLKVFKKQMEIKGLESWEDMTKRMKSFLESVINKDNNVIAAVSHSDPIRAIVTYILDMDDISGWGVRIPNASLTILRCENNIDSCKVLSIGSPLLTPQILSKLNMNIKAF
ncbi:Phosphoglycerate mutase [Sulfolobus islandicus Y.G.57.14]|jgi:probable phosphoglycerate mutase|uniref:Phosphoglycerate mutase n=6 Tax=Saccharolobus islandicus TaxID=43080 RepID=C3MJC9_SACI2|nr:2,3-diphosphoglycerate-dependent phosphoglycerate mutase [Sulfolobus islandicus]ACP34207.1 Phosphoglycerate mutase [Sulfolobus islandicus L.S.2.15]ACP44347.1 Phosphoglycerate mutase [Sulfolobus islandicus Y.G.57.14]ACP47252.1 Phosphoglycerate mutase [Sulfolobus islandicus Y.N.15.51]ACP54082.1 Phosphoglycerate mutase [Sulfolobus islandicus M.16.27]ACR40689.1 Phosphoglycerate mutase [Sulfolobus islandicus M.16.4]